MVHSLNKFRHYLLGRKFTFHFDHSTLLYLVSKQSLIGKLARWTLLLQEFELIFIIESPRVRHAMVDHLSRLESGRVKDDVQDGQLFLHRWSQLAELDQGVCDLHHPMWIKKARK